MKTDKSLEGAGLLIKVVSETIQIEVKNKQKCRFLGMLLDTLGASLFENMFAGKGEIAKEQGGGQLEQLKEELEQAKEQLEQVKEQLELARIFNAVSSFN